jgi:hypothetical protein
LIKPISSFNGDALAASAAEYDPLALINDWTNWVWNTSTWALSS